MIGRAMTAYAAGFALSFAACSGPRDATTPRPDASADAAAEATIAEKLHAYTMPRTGPNSRVKDLPDLALLATTLV